MSKKRIIILGGGMAGLAAAYELSKTEELRNQFDVSLYQRGWRLGGKCASGRAPHPADPQSLRIEEHGLHVWFGFYHNSFAMLQSCYDELRDSRVTFERMFSRRSSTPLMERVNGEWLLWPLDFPEDAPEVAPGGSQVLPTLGELWLRLIKLAADQLNVMARHLPFVAPLEAGLDVAWLERLCAELGMEELLHRRSDGAQAFADTGLPNAVTHETFLNRWTGLSDSIARLSGDELKDKLRRAWIVADLTLAALRGLDSRKDEILRNGLDVLDQKDFRQWLREDGGAHEDSLSSAPVRALYDLCFAYADGDPSSFASANFAAGAALRTMLRIGLAYRGAVCFTMNAGMGEAVIAPIYKALRANGVRFNFFERVDDLEIQEGKVSGVRFTSQVEIKSGASYEPLKTLPDGLSYWPSAPDYEQIVDGSDLQNQVGIDFESDLSAPWRGERPWRLDLSGSDVAGVILAISIGDLARISASLDQRGSSWARMLSEIETVATQSAQLWARKDLSAMGYPAPAKPPGMITAPEPMDVWADMSKALETENWSAAMKPASVQYICGPLPGSFSSPEVASDRVRAITADWLETMSSTLVWRNMRTPAGFDWNSLVASPGTQGPARLGEQHIRANYVGSHRYVLSTARSTFARLKPDALARINLYLAGDWTRNGFNAGCVEAAVMSGMQAARAIRGVPAYTMPGASDI